MAIHFDDDLIAETTSDSALDQGRRLLHTGLVTELMRSDEGPWRRGPVATTAMPRPLRETQPACRAYRHRHL